MSDMIPPPEVREPTLWIIVVFLFLWNIYLTWGLDNLVTFLKEQSDE